MSIFEVIMLICFGISWPISIAKTLKAKSVAGKSPLFMIIVMAGYASGIIHKMLYSPDWVIILYIINLAMVGVDLLLFFHFSRKKAV